MAVIKEFFKSHPVLMGLIIAVLVLLFWKVCYELGVNVGVNVK